MTLQEYKSFYNSLSRDGQREYVKDIKNGTSKGRTAKAEIKTLAKVWLDHPVRSCVNSILSAHYELINLDMNTVKTTKEYQVRAGVVLHDIINKDFKKILTAANVNEELALYHLSTNPSAIEYFVRVPADIEDRIAKYKEMNAELEGDAEVAKQTHTALLLRKIEREKARIIDARNTIKSAEKELEKLEAELKSDEPKKRKSKKAQVVEKTEEVSEQETAVVDEPETEEKID